MTRLLVYGGWYGSGNIGDDAILLGLRNILSRVNPNVEIAALSIDVAQTKRACGVEAFPLKSPRELLLPSGRGIGDYKRYFEWADACILTGGTPIYDYDHISRIIHCGFPGLLEKDLVCFGIGVKPVRSFHGKRVVRWLLRRAAAVSTRDRGSRVALKEIDSALEIRVTGDSALFLEPRPVDSPTFGNLELESLDNPVAFCPRAISPDHRAHYHAPLTRETITRMRENMAAVADHIAITGHDVVFAPMHREPGDDDSAEIAEIRGRMKEPSTVAENVESPGTMMGLLGKMNMVFGMRLHSLILAAMNGVPIVGIDYDPKIRGFMEYAGATDYIIEPEDHPETMLRTIERALDNATNLKKTLLDNIAQMRAKITEESHRIVDTINLKRLS